MRTIWPGATSTSQKSAPPGEYAAGPLRCTSRRESKGSDLLEAPHRRPRASAASTSRASCRT
eukprot:362778-Heterocapsa_arctica.AAC.1